MSLPSSWRQFQLFDVTPIKDPNYGSENPLYSDHSLSAITSTASYLVIATKNSFIKLISKEFSLLKTFIAYDLDYRIGYIKALPGSNLLVTLAERQGSPSILKLWDLNKLLQLPDENSDEDESLKHKYQTQVNIHNGDNSFPISCFQFNDDLTCVAIGYTNGKVILIRGDLIRDRGSKQRLIYETNDPITGIQFNKYQDVLYITTTSKILTVLTTGRNHGKPNRLLSKRTGVDLNCSDIDVKSQQLIVGTKDSIRYYSHLNKSHTLAFEIPKKSIFKYKKNYLLIVSPIEEQTKNNTSDVSSKAITRILIIDLYNKHIFFSLTIPNNTIDYIFTMWDDLYMLSNDGVLYKLHERPINQQIELILQRSLFNIAYDLATQANLSNDMLLKIQLLYGDHLYDKSEFEESIDAYIKCLTLYEKNDSLDANKGDDNIDDFIMTVITKFKDVSNINNLIKFLYKLYELKLANNDHLTLLLCCYCKMKMITDLDNFINELDLSENTSNKEDLSKVNLQELNFQLIINLFKECGYFTQAIELLHKLNQPSHIVGIQLNDMHQPKQCLDYMKSLAIDELLLILIDHSKSLLDSLPIETTELLINVFTGKYIPREQPDGPVNLKTRVLDTTNINSDEVAFPLNSYKAFLAYIAGSSSDKADSEESSVATNPHSEPTYLPPKPSLIFPSYINNPNEFVIFLEACIETFEKYQGNINDKKDLLITLLEMYLSLSKSNSEKNSWLSKAKELVRTYSSLLNKSSLLLISHIYDFKEGEIAAKQQSGFEESLFRTSQSSGDVEGCFEIVRKYGESKPELYKQTLKFVVSKKEIFDKVDAKDIQFILSRIKALKLATPLEVIQILSATEFATIGLIKDYLIEYIDTQKQEISNNVKLIQSYEKESTKNTHKLTELTSKPFVIQNNKCSSCKMKLDFPIVHFKCKHSYHQRCLDENKFISSTADLDGLDVTTRCCPLCINDLELAHSARADQLRTKDDIELFEQTLNEAPDRFKVITNYLGKGVMENGPTTLLETE